MGKPVTDFTVHSFFVNRLDCNGWAKSEDWDDPEIAMQAAMLARDLLAPGSGYIGPRDEEALADRVIWLLRLDPERPFGRMLILQQIGPLSPEEPRPANRGKLRVV